MIYRILRIRSVCRVRCSLTLQLAAAFAIFYKFRARFSGQACPQLQSVPLPSCLLLARLCRQLLWPQ